MTGIQLAVTKFSANIPDMSEIGKRGNVEVTPAAKVGLGKIKGWSGLPFKVIVERMALWLSNQEEDVQGPIILAVPRSRQQEFARLVLEKTAERQTPTTPPASMETPEEEALREAGEREAEAHLREQAARQALKPKPHRGKPPQSKAS